MNKTDSVAVFRAAAPDAAAPSVPSPTVTYGNTIIAGQASYNSSVAVLRTELRRLINKANPTAKDMAIAFAIDAAIAALEAQASAPGGEVTEEVVAAAHAYFTGWCQDEADDDGPHFTGCSQEQHEAAKRLKTALAALAARTGKPGQQGE